MVRTIKDWDPPHDSTTLGALVGALNYMRKFVRNYSKKIRAISDLVKKTGKYHKGKPVPLAEPWAQKHQEELDNLLGELLKPPVLMHPDFGPDSGPFIISVDTSSHLTISFHSETSDGTMNWNWLTKPESETMINSGFRS